MIYLTSDLHLSHDRDFVWFERGFASVDQMNDGLIKRFNSVITDEDDLYILGDCCLGLNEIAFPYLERFNGHKHLIIGNHDTETRLEEYKNRGLFETIEYGGRIKFNKRIYILSHFPMLVGNNSNEKVWNLHGHTHQKSKFGTIPQCYHVGVDSHACYPVSLEQIHKDITEARK